MYLRAGKMAEWSIAAVLKTVELKGSGGSNPSLSATISKSMNHTNSIWVAHIEKAKQEIQSGKVTAIKSGDVWKTIQENLFTFCPKIKK